MPIDQTFALLLEQLHLDILPNSLQYMIAMSPVFLMVILATIFFPLWLNYVRSKNFLGLKYVVLEIKLPKDTWKSPKAMEIVLNSIHNPSDGSMYAQYWKGETRPWYSLEIISIEGDVKLMIWTEDRRKMGLLAGLYSQFPEIEVSEREDYSRSVHFNPDEIKMWSCEMEFTKPNPYPIKTYVDFGLDKDPKEEFKADPLLPLIEWLGSVGPNQQVWIQILVRAHKKDQIKPGHLFKKTDLWQDEAKDLVNKMLLRDSVTKVAGLKDEATGFTKLPTISEGEKTVVEAIERSVSKYAFDAGIRALYIAKKDFFDGPFGIGGIIGSFKQFGSENLNGFKPGDKWHNILSDPWQDYNNWRRNRFSRLVLMAYRRRSFFYPPFKGKPLVLNTEELATIFHFPGSVAATPTLERVPSKKSQAPMNLPT